MFTLSAPCHDVSGQFGYSVCAKFHTGESYFAFESVASQNADMRQTPGIYSNSLS
jgi:hypothetical protein